MLYFNFAFSINAQRETDNFLDVYEVTKKLSSKIKNKEILLVFDLDNTILSMKKSLGSDQWFNWKREKIKNKPQLFPALLKWQEILFYHSEMKLTEDYIPRMIKTLQNNNIRMIALTSRSPSNRFATQRELNRFHIDFSATKIGKNIPLKKYQKREIEYKNGIFMTSGLGKGELLKKLIDHSRLSSLKQVIFIDDHSKHTESVYQTFQSSNIDVLTYRYKKEDDRVSRFHNSSSLQGLADKNLKKLQLTIKKIFGSKLPMI